MNISDFWETVVLRDILGYIVPGAVTVFALGLLVTGLCGVSWYEIIGACSNAGLRVILDVLNEYRWLLLVIILPLSFVAGHVQAKIIEPFEERERSWNLGSLARQFLTDDKNKMGTAYQDAVLDTVDGQRSTALSAWLRNCKDFSDTARNYHDPAWHLWKLCDYYVLSKAPQVHATYMGRYYVLAVLFTNLGVSTLLLVVGLLVVVFRLRGIAGLLPALAGAGVPFAAALFFRVLPHDGPNGLVRRWFPKVNLGIAVAALVGLLVPACQVPALEAALLAVGLGLMYLSGHFRRQFVERAFPILYAITVEKRQSLGQF